METIDIIGSIDHMSSIYLYFPHIAFYLALFFVFTYFSARIKWTPTDIAGLFREHYFKRADYMVLFILVSSSIIIIGYGIYLVFYDGIDTYYDVTFFYTTLLFHTAIFMSIAYIGFLFLFRLIMGEDQHL